MTKATAAAAARHDADPRVLRSQAIILTAATTHFTVHGYMGANVDVIAAEAGVSKRTVYNVFGGKEQLFRAVVDNAVTIAESFSRDLADELTAGDDLPADLERIGVRLATAVLDGPVVPLRQLLIGESRRFPELVSDYYRRAPERVMRTLADHLAGLSGRGLLDLDDPMTAAEHFAFLVMGAPLDRALFHIDSTPSRSEIEANARAGVAAFLRAWGRAPKR